MHTDLNHFLLLRIAGFWVITACWGFSFTAKAASTLSDTATVNQTKLVIDSLAKVDGDSALVLAKTNLSRARKLGYVKGTFEARTQLVRILTQTGEVEQALELANENWSEAERIGTVRQQVDAAEALGYAYAEQASFEEALKWQFKQLELAESSGDSILVAGSCNAIGRTFSKGQSHNKSLQYLNRAARLFAQNEAWGKHARVMANIGVTGYRIDNDPTKASGHFRRALESALRTNDFLLAANTLNNLSFMLHQTGKTDSALHCSRRALGYYLQLEDARGIMAAAQNLSMTYAVMNRMDSAFFYQRRQLTYARHYDQTDQIAYAFDGIASLHEQAGNLDSALHYYKRFHLISDSLFGARSSARLAEVEGNYEQEKLNLEAENLRQREALTDAKLALQNTRNQWLMLGGGILLLGLLVVGWLLMLRQRSNRVLQHKNTEIAEQKTAIEASLAEKEVLLREIHHRVKNNLQVVSSLLNLQSNAIEDEAALDAVREGQNRVKSMALIHKKLYQTDHLNAIDFQDYIEQLLDYLQETYGRDQARVSVDAKGIDLDIDTAIPLGLIINELVSNAYKYAFQSDREGELLIKLDREKESGFALTVKDNGQGLPDGFAWEESESLGLRLVHLLSQQINGSMSYRYQQGAMFRLLFRESLVTN